VSRILLVYQPYGEATVAEARRVADYLQARGERYDLCSTHELSGRSVNGVRLALSFGGDGTALRTARLVCGEGAPVVPIRMGKLSFLGELSTSDLPDGLDPYLEGEFWVDERSMLEVAADGQEALALNDAVLGRGESARAVSTEVRVDGASVVYYLADGVIVSTPTGSTAYSLAAGGPVLAPHMRAMVVTPIAAHLTALRSLVLPDDARVELVNRGHSADFLTVDGQLDFKVEPGEAARVSIASQTSRFARRGPRVAFYEGLAARLSRG
jgi:NAD+ kinase